MIVDDIAGLYDRTHNICVVGSGPVGIVVAMELARRGQAVTLIESGGLTFDPGVQELSRAAPDFGRRNIDMTLAVRRVFGGTSNLWGAGCMPLDPIDFERRDFVGLAGWPLSYDAFAVHLPAACGYANCGHGFHEDVPGFHNDDQRFTANNLIRFADPPSFARAHAEAIRTSRTLTVFLGGTATGFRFDENGRIKALEVRSLTKASGFVRARLFVLACGGVETTRLLLAAQLGSPARFGGPDGPLGRNYMGHLSGQIADIECQNVALDRAFDFFRCPDGAYARRRLMAGAALQRREGLSNVSFWPVMPSMRDFRHRDPVLSLAYLALCVPSLGRALVSESLRRSNVGDGRDKLRHVVNVVTGMPSIMTFLPHFLYRRFLADRRLPGLHIRNPAKRYMLHFHAEHLPSPSSRIRLSTECDALGVPRIRHDLRFSERDAEHVLRTHDHLSVWLQDTGAGRLTWHMPQEERLARVMELAGDGVHQIGTARMAHNTREGVVDCDCRVFGSCNLFLAGSSVFPTSGQANPTLAALALAVRTAGIIAAEARTHDVSQPVLM